MNKIARGPTINCPGCGQDIVLDDLKKHLKRAHGFQEPFSLSQAVFVLSKGKITATELYSEKNFINTTIDLGSCQFGTVQISTQSQLDLPTGSQQLSKTYEECPNCRASKHKLNACSACGFTQRAIEQNRNKADKISSKVCLSDSEHKVSPNSTQNTNEQEFIKCPHCAATLRKYRLESHIRKVHEVPKVRTRPEPKKKKNLGRSASTAKFTSGKCMVCGRTAIPGDNVCYTHSR